MCYEDQPVDTIPNGRYTIEVWNDTTPSNPFEDCDSNVPLMIEGGRNFRSHDYGDVEQAVMGGLYSMPSDRLESLAGSVDGGSDALFAAKESANEGEDAYRWHLADLLADLLPLDGSDKLDYLESVCDVLGWPCLNTCSTGYSQGDYVDALAVWLPKFGAYNRQDAAPEDIAKELQAAVDLFGAWAWGDVYGYVVKGPDGEGIASCWGYYGTDHNKSGLLEAATAEIEHHQRTTAKEHFAKLKQWIAARVPVMYRQPMPAI